MIQYQIKTHNKDFKVEEVLSLPEKGGEIGLYILRKEGISTFDALDLVCARLGLNRNQISYAGLKDEDGITSQYVTIKNAKEYYHSDFIEKSSSVSLRHLYNTSQMLEPGEVKANKFEVIVRNISKTFVVPKVFWFINYYGVQRFGFPNEQKDSHILGELLINSSEDKLLKYVHQNKRLRLHPYLVTKPDDTDCPRRAFLKSSYSSYLWNKSLSDFIQKEFTEVKERKIEDLKYAYADLMKLNNVDLNKDILYRSYKVDSTGRERLTFKLRKAFQKVSISKSEVIHDTCMTGCSLKINFELPTGSYATVFIDQLVHSC